MTAHATAAQVKTSIGTKITDNSNKENTAARVRQSFDDVVDTMFDSSVADVHRFGAVGDGTTSDSAALQAALATGKKVVLRKGSTYLVDSAIVLTSDVNIEGNGAEILVNVPDGIALDISGNVTIAGVIFDGGGSTTQEILRLQGTGKNYLITKSTFKDIKNATLGSFAVRVEDVDAGYIVFEDCSFSGIRGVANSVQGDSPGAPRAIFVEAGSRICSIVRCEFDDVRSVDGSDVPVYEDSDAIQVHTTRGIDLILIAGCKFSNIGKRCIKLFGGTNNLIKDCNASSPWTTSDVGMAAFASVFNGDVTVRRCYFNGGHALCFVDAASELGTSLSIESCEFNPTIQETVSGNTTYALRIGRGTMNVKKFTATNVERAIHIYNSAASKLIIEDSEISSENNFVIVYAGNTVEIYDSTISQASADVGTIVAHTIDGFAKFVASNSKFSGFDYVAYVSNQTNDAIGDWLIRMTDCDTTEITTPIRNNFGATKENVYHSGNTFDSMPYAYIASNAVPAAPDRFKGTVAQWNTSIANGASLIQNPANLRSGESIFLEPTKNGGSDTLDFTGDEYVDAAAAESAFAALAAGESMLIEVRSVGDKYYVSTAG